MIDILSACLTYLEAELAKTAREIRELTPYSQLFAAELGALHAKHDAITNDIQTVMAQQQRQRSMRRGQ
jgi:hypothetical protein